MPTISRFYGIVIAMFFNDHAPPHVHARYAEHHATIAIESGTILAGDLPSRAAHLVEEWVVLHRAELERNWQLARDLQPLDPIEALA